MTDVPTIEVELARLQKESKAQARTVLQDTSDSQLLDGLKSDIDAVAKKQKQSTDSYAGKYEDLRKAWEQQKVTIDRLKTDIKLRFPDYQKNISDICAQILKKITDQQAIVDGHTVQQRQQEKDVAEKKKFADSAKSTLDAWLTADAKLATRLADIDKAIKNLQGVFGGADQAFAIYLLWFQVIPPHHEIKPPDITFDDDFSGDPPGCLPKLDPKALCLVKPNEYPIQLQTAWREYSSLRKELGKAEVVLKLFQDTVANDTADLKRLIDSRDNDIKQKLKSLTDSGDNDFKQKVNASSRTHVVYEGTQPEGEE